MHLNTALFWILAILTGGCAVAVVVSQNIVRAAAWLLFALGGTAGVFFLLGADFVGATQLLVYVGGTLVLVVFGVMLTAQGPFISMRIGAAEWFISMVVGLLLYAVLAVTLWNTPTPAPPQVGAAAEPVPGGGQSSTTMLGLAFTGDTHATPEGFVTGAPGLSRTRTRIAYLLPFEIVSVHLLVVLIGAAYLARAKRRRTPAPVPGTVEPNGPPRNGLPQPAATAPATGAHA